MSKIHLVIPDSHAIPGQHNDRADWLAGLIGDIKPDVVVNIGDQWDFPSLSSYDKGKREYSGRSYRADLEAGLEFSDRLWGPVRRRKKKLPDRYFFIGNHEERIDRALDLSPELEGTISYNDLDLDRDYNEVIHYEGGTPGVKEIDGIHYAHYFISGVMGRALGGEHPAHALVTKQFVSCTSGHLHLRDECIRTTADGKKIVGAVVGVYQDYDSVWAGNINKLWWRGVLIKHNVENGYYDSQWISIDSLKKEYGKK